MSLRAFAATVAILVPAGWHGSEATIEKDGKKIRPLQKEVTIDGARVTIDVDRNLVNTGDPVTLKLRAFSDEDKEVAVDVYVLQSDDSFGSRVAGPPHAIDKEHLTLHASKDGGKVVDTRIVMKPNQGVDKIDWFRIYVGKKGTPVEDFGGDGDDSVAAIPVLGWSTNDYGISIEPAGKLTAGAPFEVAVRLENTTAETINHRPYIHLGTSVGLYSIENSEDFEVEQIDDGGFYEKKWKPGQKYTARFKVTPQRPDIKSVTFIASAYTYGEDMSPVSGGAMDAQTFKVKPETTHEVAAK